MLFRVPSYADPLSIGTYPLNLNRNKAPRLYVQRVDFDGTSKALQLYRQVQKYIRYVFMSENPSGQVPRCRITRQQSLQGRNDSSQSGCAARVSYISELHPFPLEGTVDEFLDEIA